MFDEERGIAFMDLVSGLEKLDRPNIAKIRFGPLRF